MINLMWQLYYEADGQGVSWARGTSWSRSGELRSWVPGVASDRLPELGGLPFTTLCILLDRMLTELGRVTPGFGARVALARTRSCLDPEHDA